MVKLYSAPMEPRFAVVPNHAGCGEFLDHTG